MNNPVVLAIDTSCDDTSAAVTCGLEVWSNVIASQTELHKPYGGVFPTVAKQAHKENIEAVVKLALQRAGVLATNITQIAVTVGPGLAPALEVGINYAKMLGSGWNVPVVPVNHIEGHLLSVLAVPRISKNKTQNQNLDDQIERSSKHTYDLFAQIESPALGVIVSGGHTEFVLISSISSSRTSEKNQAENPSLDRKPRLSLTANPADESQVWLSSGRFRYEKLGQTVDDAAGEALDKIGRMLNLGYPAGPVVEQLAKLGNPHRYEFPLPMTTTHDFNLSFSGMKTFSRRFIESNWASTTPSQQELFDFCASLQYSIFRHICYKLNKILLKYPETQSVWLGGGVAANTTLRKMLRQTLRSLPHQQRHLTLKTPYTKRLCMDNAGMIGITVAN